MSRHSEQEVSMLKTVTVGFAGFALGAATVATMTWTKSQAAHLQAAPAATAGMPSIGELYAKARAQGLPDQTVKDPYGRTE
jgi:hypothetical protein